MSLYVIIGGKVMVRRMTADGGRQLLVDIYVVDEFFGDWALTDSINSYEKAIAVEQDTRVMAWTNTEIQQLILLAAAAWHRAHSDADATLYWLQPANRELFFR